MFGEVNKKLSEQEMSKFDECDACEQKVRMKILQEFLYNQFMEGAMDLPDDYYSRYGKDLKRFMKERRKNGFKPYVFYTVNPKYDNPKLLMECTQRAIKRVFVDEYLYCYEWDGRGVTHLHLRIKVKEGYNSYKVRGLLDNTFKKLGIFNADHLYGTTTDCFVAYINGKRKGVWKEGHLNDVAMRIKYNMKQKYHGFGPGHKS